MILFNPAGQEVNINLSQLDVLLNAGWTKQKKVVKPTPVKRQVKVAKKPSAPVLPE